MTDFADGRADFTDIIGGSCMTLLYEDLSYKIRKCLFDVHNALGAGHKENIYQKALELELAKNDIIFERQKTLDVFYDGRKIGIYRPDFVIDGKIIIEIKATEFNVMNYKRQLIYYLKGTNYQLGFLVNFGTPSLTIERVIWT